MLWKQDNYQTAVDLYDCVLCQRNNLIEKQNRICFKFDHADDEIDILIPEMEGRKYVPIGDWEIRHCDKVEILEALTEYEELDPAIPTFEALMNRMIEMPEKEFGKNKEICPIGLMDNQCWDLIELEGFCNAYKVVPVYPPCVDEQPPILVEAFMTILAEKNKYEMVRLQRMKEKK